MNRICEQVISSPVSSWTAPAGVTEILLAPVDGTNLPVTSSSAITVVPSTTYSITINSASYTANNSNTFGSLFSWTGTANLKISWVE